MHVGYVLRKCLFDLPHPKPPHTLGIVDFGDILERDHLRHLGQEFHFQRVPLDALADGLFFFGIFFLFFIFIFLVWIFFVWSFFGRSSLSWGLFDFRHIFICLLYTFLVVIFFSQFSVSKLLPQFDCASLFSY